MDCQRKEFAGAEGGELGKNQFSSADQPQNGNQGCRNPHRHFDPIQSSQNQAIHGAFGLRSSSSKKRFRALWPRVSGSEFFGHQNFSHHRTPPESSGMEADIKCPAMAGKVPPQVTGIQPPAAVDANGSKHGGQKWAQSSLRVMRSKNGLMANGRLNTHKNVCPP